MNKGLQTGPDLPIEPAEGNKPRLAALFVLALLVCSSAWAVEKYDPCSGVQDGPEGWDPLGQTIQELPGTIRYHVYAIFEDEGHFLPPVSRACRPSEAKNCLPWCYAQGPPDGAELGSELVDIQCAVALGVGYGVGLPFCSCAWDHGDSGRVTDGL